MGAGHDPRRMMIPLRVQTRITETESALEPRGLLSGTPEQVAEDLYQVEKLGFDQFYFDLNYPAAIPIDPQLRLFRRLVKIVG